MVHLKCCTYKWLVPGRRSGSSSTFPQLFMHFTFPVTNVSKLETEIVTTFFWEPLTGVHTVRAIGTVPVNNVLYAFRPLPIFVTFQRLSTSCLSLLSTWGVSNTLLELFKWWRDDLKGCVKPFVGFWVLEADSCAIVLCWASSFRNRLQIGIELFSAQWVKSHPITFVHQGSL